MDDAVKKVIVSINNRLADPITVEELAGAARFSRFHFSRLFQRNTGMSPARFLAALRMAEARRLLTSTSMKVADISFSVGYASVGTFTSRFTATAGLSPTRYRHLTEARREAEVSSSPGGATVVGVIQPPAEWSGGSVYVGLFPVAAPDRPIRSAVLTPPAPCRFTAVPPGDWYLGCVFVDGAPSTLHTSDEVLRRARYVLAPQPFRTGAHTTIAVVDVHADDLRPADPDTVRGMLGITGRLAVA